MSNRQPISQFVLGSLEKSLGEIHQKGSLISHAKSKLGEPIHNFRVDCRRGLAALDFYQSVVTKGCFKRLRSTIRKLLRQSNLGRDLDVIIQALKNKNSPGATQFVRRLKKDFSTMSTLESGRRNQRTNFGFASRNSGTAWNWQPPSLARFPCRWTSRS